MSRFDETFYPKVLKVITLPEDERKALRRVFQTSQSVRHRLSGMIQSIIEDGLDAEEEAWDMIAGKFGYGDLTAL